MASLIALRLDHCFLNLFSGVTGEDQRLNVILHFLPQDFKGDLFIIAAGNQNDLLVEGMKSSNGPGGAGGNGVVVIAHPVQRPHQLDAVLHAGECLSRV